MKLLDFAIVKIALRAKSCVYLEIVLINMSAVGLMAYSGSPSFELTANGSGDQIPLTVTFTPSEQTLTSCVGTSVTTRH